MNVVQTAAAAARKYLTFRLGSQGFGIEVLHIKEIIQMQEITAVPKTPAHVKGVINLRGQVIPVLCLAARFGMMAEPVTAQTCVIVVRVRTAAGERLIGAMADGVSEVLAIPAEDIEPRPDFGTGAPLEFLRGMAKVRGKVKMLLDAEAVFGGDWLTA